MQNNEQEVLIVNESSETVVNTEKTDKSPEPLSDHVAENEVMIMEEEVAVDLSITSKNITAEGNYIFCIFKLMYIILNLC